MRKTIRILSSSQEYIPVKINDLILVMYFFKQPVNQVHVLLYHLDGVHKVFGLAKNLAIKKKSTIVVQSL